MKAKTESTGERVLIIACGVLRLDLESMLENLPVDVETEYLDGGLHEVPNQLRDELQTRIDEASASGEYSRIAVGYGVCGRGTVGLKARNVPLTIPRVHDCIALFLGSDELYRREFKAKPGTYYIAGGWFEEQVGPQGGYKSKARSMDEALRRADFDYYKKKYGEQNAREIIRFYNSWQKNYSRAAFIDTGTGEAEKYESYARDLAREFDWEFQRLEGTHRLLKLLLTEDETTAEILFVPREHSTEYDSRGRGLIAVPVWKREDAPAASPAQTQAPAADSEAAAAPAQTQASQAPPAGPETAAPPPASQTQGAAAQTQAPAADSEAAAAPAQTPAVETPPQTPASQTPASQTPTSEHGRRRRYGLGIDAGGTYTDSAVYDFHSQKVLSKAKGLTTRWDYTVGIEESVSGLDRSLLGRVELVSVSTTLATNAIVEGYGQRVGLLLMPSGLYDPELIDHEPTAILSGRLAISGEETEPLDTEEVRRTVRKMAEKGGVEVFAVSGYAGSVNPTHELAVKKIITEETGLYVCCGHELSDLLNFYVRAHTAVLNARIIPLLETFLSDVDRSLKGFGIEAPVMVVKGDGSLMSAEMARSRPIETILSGPAASIAGARFLTGAEEATVVDVGGTTSDIGCITEGRVEVNPGGARVGGRQTHVQALDMRTVGLGGDSEILVEGQKFHIGPKRVAPISWLAARYDLQESLDYLKKRIDYTLNTTEPLEFLALTEKSQNSTAQTSGSRRIQLTDNDKRILEALEDEPASLLELAGRTGVDHWMMLQTRRLEDMQLLQRCGLTPTDILHASGRMNLWERQSAAVFIEIVSGRTGYSSEEFSRLVFQRIRDRLIVELMKSELEVDGHSDEVESCPACAAVMENILSGGSRRFRLAAEFHHPVIGLGAPVNFFLEEIPEKVSAEIIVPEYADVANAVGAITSFITVSGKLSIIPTVEGTFRIHGLAEAPEFSELDEADRYGRAALQEQILEDAKAAGTSENRPQLHSEDSITRAADGAELFLERILTAKITGPPDLA
ncbi:MAG: DUF1638 domain-containing protein [Spirochaetales bacterium]|nr:DUF1638 domain-containing protein [Spirochaetales bacterium]MCF7938063.1 DUF1638 domain-containing protein [Spirochaetales bacterium]